MAEIVAVIGSVGALVNIIDAATKVISTIHKLQAQWKDANLVVLSLASQLSAFRAALRRIQEWLDSEVPAAHHQLVMDLDETLSFCKILIIKIEVLSGGWETMLEDPKAIAGRWKVTVGGKGLDNVLVLVERQTNALTLLLTACNCKSTAEQKQLLERPRTRRILQRAKADSASLFVHQDTSSRKSRLTDNLSKMSKVFDFDPAVFSSGVYHRVFRGSLKSSLRQQQHPLALGSPTKEVMNESSKPNSNRPGSTGGLSSITAAFIETGSVAVDAGAANMTSSNFPPDYDSIYPHDEHNNLIQIETSGTASTIIPQETTNSRSPVKLSLSQGNSLALVQLCEARMLEDCDEFAACYIKRLAELDAEHALTYFDDQAGQITRRISQAHIIWRDPTFQQLLLGGPSGPILGGPSMTLCRFIAYQMKALREDRFQHQVGDCLETLALAYETGSMHRAQPQPQHFDHVNTTDYSVLTAWSRTKHRPKSDSLTVIISVPIAEHHYRTCNRIEVIEDLTTSLQPLMYDVKYCTPAKFEFVLLLHGSEHFMTKLPAMCFPIAPSSQNCYLNVVLAKIVRLIRHSNEDTLCDFLTVWDNQQLKERILGAAERVAREGQVTIENGIRRAKLP